MQQTELDDFELHFTDRADDFDVSLIAEEELGHAFIGKLTNSLVQLLGLEWISIDKLSEYFR